MMDVSTDQVSSLPDMINIIQSLFGVGTENDIFVFGIETFLHSPDRFSDEIYETASGIWLLLPSMIEERSRRAAVNIPGFGVLVIGGTGRNGLPLCYTELLTRLPNERGGGGGEKWQWRHFPPSNYDHRGFPLSVNFQGRVYIVGCGGYLNEIQQAV
ncbi:unnamed protein product, partial [Hymenolepis diminuta]